MSQSTIHSLRHSTDQSAPTEISTTKNRITSTAKRLKLSRRLLGWSAVDDWGRRQRQSEKR